VTGRNSADAAPKQPWDLGAWVRTSCEAQGVPVKISDPAVVAKVVTLLGGSALAQGARSGRPVPGGGGSPVRAATPVAPALGQAS
jgi:hypothetical protein